MPRYEMILISRVLNREGYSNVLRHTCTSIMDKGGVVRKIENLGQQNLPHRMRANTEWHYAGRYFLLDFDLGVHHLPQVKKELRAELDVIRQGITIKQGRYDSLKKEHSLLECWKSYTPPKGSDDLYGFRRQPKPLSQ